LAGRRAMNSFLEHHKDSIRFHYRCFDRILLNGLIQPFQRPERWLGSSILTASCTRCAVIHCAASRIASNSGCIPGRQSATFRFSTRRKAAVTSSSNLISRGKTRRGRRRAEGARTGPHHDRHRRQGHQPLAPAIRRALGRSVQLLRQRSAMGPHVRAHVPLLAILRADLPQPASLAGHSDARGRHRLPPMLECLHALAPNPNACKSLPTS